MEWNFFLLPLNTLYPLGANYTPQISVLLEKVHRANEKNEFLLADEY